VLANALFRQDMYVQAFPAFGVERRGAPVVAFTRFDHAPIRHRCEIYEPDHLIVLDQALTQTIDITAGLKPGGWIVLNTRQSPDAFDFGDQFGLAVVDASDIAWRHKLGSRATPIVNTAILGAFARATGLVEMESVFWAIDEAVPVQAQSNRAAAQDAYDETVLVEAAAGIPARSLGEAS